MPLKRSIPNLKEEKKEEYKIHESMVPKWAKSDLS
jgi:hypothetical protein